MKNIHDHEWTIEAKDGLFDLQLKECWEYRDLLWLLVRRDFVSFYKQTVLGPIWHLLQPLLTTVVFTLVFGRLAGISTDGLPHALFYMAGITAWNYFADCLTKTSTVFKDNSQIFGKVYFPRLIMPLSIVMSNMVRFGMQLLMFLALMLLYYLRGEQFHITWAIALFPFIVLLMAAQGLGLGMIISSMTTKYRDLAFLVTFGVQLLMYATTVIYPLSSAPHQFQTLLRLNPMTSVIETFRYGFLGKGSFDWMLIGYSSIITVVTLLCGIIVFNKVQKTFIDTV